MMKQIPGHPLIPTSPHYSGFLCQLFTTLLIFLLNTTLEKIEGIISLLHKNLGNIWTQTGGEISQTIFCEDHFSIYCDPLTIVLKTVARVLVKLYDHLGILPSVVIQLWNA